MSVPPSAMGEFPPTALQLRGGDGGTTLRGDAVVPAPVSVASCVTDVRGWGGGAGGAAGSDPGNAEINSTVSALASTIRGFITGPSLCWWLSRPAVFFTQRTIEGPPFL